MYEISLLQHDNISSKNYQVNKDYHYQKAMKLMGHNTAHKAIFKELEQLHLRNMFIPLKYQDLSKEEIEAAIESHTLVKEKTSGEIKAWTVADGRKQCETIANIEVMSPTKALDALLLTCMIDAKEGREVCTLDILNAFIQSNIGYTNRIIWSALCLNSDGLGVQGKVLGLK